MIEKKRKVKMKMDQKKLLVVSILFFFQTISFLFANSTVKLPGNPAAVNYYITHSLVADSELASEDLLFHLNEILLFETQPTFDEVADFLLKNIVSANRRQRMRERVIMEYRRTSNTTFVALFKNTLKSFHSLRDLLLGMQQNIDEPLYFNVKGPDGFASSKNFLEMSGLLLKQDDSGKYYLQESFRPPLYEINHLYKWLGINVFQLEKELNLTGEWECQLQNYDVPLPWDLTFLGEITGLNLTPDNFIQSLCDQPALSLLLGTLYRLSQEEIDFISHLEPHQGMWQRIYGNQRLMRGMFLLAHGLRVRNNRLLLPGGENAVAFWHTFTGIHPFQQPAQFLEKVALFDEGKLNYFYTFGFFLPQVTQKVAFCDFDADAFRRLYDLWPISKTEKIRGAIGFGLKDFSLFTLLYSLPIRDNQLYFPGGMEIWAPALGATENNFQAILTTLLKPTDFKKRVQSFVAVLSKFSDRPELLNPTVLSLLLQKYEEYNVMVDFIEKLPVHKPETVQKLMAWAISLSDLKGSKEEMNSLTAIFQAVLELLSNSARYNPDRYDYDDLLDQLMNIPLRGAETYDGIFKFLTQFCKVNPNPNLIDQSFLDFAFAAIKNPLVTVRNQSYWVDTVPLVKHEVTEILKKQEAFSLSQLQKINALLEEFRSASLGHNQRGKLLLESLDQLPDTAQNSLMREQVKRLIAKKNENVPVQEIDTIIAGMKGGGLLQHLKHFLVSNVYAVATKNSMLRVFLNPNFVRMHDFDPLGPNSAWNSCEITLGESKQPRYHLEGGLSRIAIKMASPLAEELFQRKIFQNTTLTTPIIYNNLDLFPLSTLDRAQEYTGLLVQLGTQLVENAQKKGQAYEWVKEQLTMMASGFRYRTWMETLSSSTKNSLSNSGELLRLGEQFFMNPTPEWGEEILAHFPEKEALDAYHEPTLYARVREEMNVLGPIFYYTFGKLKPHRFTMFPQELSDFYQNKWTATEMIDEFKIKLAYTSYKKKMPPQLVGLEAYKYLVDIAKNFSPFYDNDYHWIYSLYRTYSNLNLEQLIKEFKHQGVLRLK